LTKEIVRIIKKIVHRTKHSVRGSCSDRYLTLAQHGAIIGDPTFRRLIASEVIEQGGLSLDRAHVGALETEWQIDLHVLKYRDSSKLKFVIFWRFFDLDPSFKVKAFDLCFLKAATDTHILAKFQFCSFTFTLSKTAVTELATGKSITSIFLIVTR
jgi:hypothetical protein